MNKLILRDIIMKNIHKKLNLIHKFLAVMEFTFFVVISMPHNSICQSITRSDCVLRCVTPTMGRGAVSYNNPTSKVQLSNNFFKNNPCKCLRFSSLVLLARAQRKKTLVLLCASRECHNAALMLAINYRARSIICSREKKGNYYY